MCCVWPLSATVPWWHETFSKTPVPWLMQSDIYSGRLWSYTDTQAWIHPDAPDCIRHPCWEEDTKQLLTVGESEVTERMRRFSRSTSVTCQSVCSAVMWKSLPFSVPRHSISGVILKRRPIIGQISGHQVWHPRWGNTHGWMCGENSGTLRAQSLAGRATCAEDFFVSGIS